VTTGMGKRSAMMPIRSGGMPGSPSKPISSSG
jgi:hypothetical protein